MLLNLTLFDAKEGGKLMLGMYVSEYSMVNMEKE